MSDNTPVLFEGQAALFDDPQSVMALSASELRVTAVDIARRVHPTMAEIRRVVGLVCWAMRAKVPAGEYGKWVEGYAEIVGVTARTLGEWRTKAEKSAGAVPAYSAPRKPKTAGQTTQLEETSKPIPATSEEVPAESSAGVTATASAFVGPVDSGSSADPSSGGAELQPTPAGPTGETTAPRPAPPDPPEDSIEALAGRMADYLATRNTPWKDEAVMREAAVEAVTQLLTQAQDNVWRLIGDRPPPDRPPSDRQLAARVFAAMREIKPTDAGPVTTPEEATFLRQWAQRTLDAWKAVYAPPAPAEKPQRRQGTITRPSRLPSSRPEDWTEIGPVDRPLRLPSVPTPIAPYSPPRTGKRHADDCSCLACKAPKAVAK